MPALQLATRSVRVLAVTVLLAGVTAGSALGAPAAVAVARTGLAAPVASSAVSGQLSGVAAVSARSAWAVGRQAPTGPYLTEQWNGSAW